MLKFSQQYAKKIEKGSRRKFNKGKEITEVKNSLLFNSAVLHICKKKEHEDGKFKRKEIYDDNFLASFTHTWGSSLMTSAKKCPLFDPKPALCWKM